jgi:hypothetical protein
MRAREFINEILYSNNISNSSMILSELNPKIDNKIGIVDHHPVHIKDGGNCIIYYLIDDKSNIQCYIIVEKNKSNGYNVFRQAEKVDKNKKGTMTALVQFLVSNNIKLLIKNSEPMTMDGLEWVIGLINNPRGLNIHDDNNKKITPQELDDEWTYSLNNPGQIGKINIYIESKNMNQSCLDYCFEDQTQIIGLFKNPHRFIEATT